MPLAESVHFFLDFQVSMVGFSITELHAVVY